jgi:non-specific serine/threonine protein kinase
LSSLVGQLVSHYKVTRQLGSGGMGVVYEAEDTNICTVFAIETHEGQNFIVMELLDGESLGQVIQRGPVPMGRLLELGIQMADALESAHAKGIVHRDIKPANIIVNERGQSKILDFGLAKVEEAQAVGGTTEASQFPTRVQDLTQAGTTLGTVSYMSPEQARGQLTDARTDLFSLGTVLYQMATGNLPFDGETSAVVFSAILNEEPSPVTDANPELPAELGRILGKALEKDRSLRYQSANDLKTDLIRLRRDLDSGSRPAAEVSDSHAAAAEKAEKSIAVLYLENLSGVKDDEYCRDGVTEDVITELSKIKNLNIFSRATVLSYRDKPVTPAQIGQQLGAAYVLTGSLRRAGNRLRIYAQLVDTKTDFPLWSERYDREMKDVFDVQDEIACKIAEALRVTLSPQEQKAIAAKPTENLQAYDLYLRGKSYARRLTRQDMEFALQMFENAVAQDSDFALAYAAIANVCAQYYYHFDRGETWIERAHDASRRADALRPDLPEVQVASAWIRYAEKAFDDATRLVRQAIEVKTDCEGAWYLLGRTLFEAGQYQELADVAETAIKASGEDFNVYVPIENALGALGKQEQRRNVLQLSIQALETHLRKMPEDARARTILAVDYAETGRTEDAEREANLAMVLRPNEATVLYNVACVLCGLGKTGDAMEALKKAWDAGYRDPDWVRRDPDLASLHDLDEFQRLYPEKPSE